MESDQINELILDIIKSYDEIDHQELADKVLFRGKQLGITIFKMNICRELRSMIYHGQIELTDDWKLRYNRNSSPYKMIEIKSTLVHTSN